MAYGSLSTGCEERLDPAGTGSLFNEGEADIVVQHVLCLINSGSLLCNTMPMNYQSVSAGWLTFGESGVRAKDIAVQSPYVAQVQLLREKLEDFPVEVATIDSFQGREADAVIISMVLTYWISLILG